MFLAGLPDVQEISFLCHPPLVMALTRTQKAAQIAELKDKMSNASSIIFTQYIGLTVSDITKLRSALRKEGCVVPAAPHEGTKEAG